MNAAVRKIVAARPVGVEVALSRSINWSRALKLTGSLGLLATGCYAITSSISTVTSSNAVVTAYTVALRTPIDGSISASNLRIGQRVEEGSLLATIGNPLVDQKPLSEFQIRLEKAEATSKAIAAEISSLLTFHSELEARSAAFVSATVARLEGLYAETQAKLAAANLNQKLAGLTLQRRHALEETGHASIADLDKAQSDFEVALQEVAVQQGALAALGAQLSAARNGIVADNNGTDAPYSKQRADEIAMRIGELRREQQAVDAEIERTELGVKEERSHIDKLAKSNLNAPMTGMVWKVSATSGERVGVGDNVAQIVDCGSAFLMASIPQDRVPDIEVGSEVEYRLSGDTQKRIGQVVSVTGDVAESERNLAAVPLVSAGSPTAIVRVGIEKEASQCLVGRTARVVFPSASRGLSELFSRLM